MFCEPLMWRKIIHSGNPCVLLGRVLSILGEPFVQADLTSIAYFVYDRAGATVTSGTLVVATSVFDTLQTTEDDPRWEEDDTGYNFAGTMPAAGFPTPHKLYVVKLVFDPVSGDDVKAYGIITTKDPLP